MRMMVINSKTDTTALSSRLLASRSDTLETLRQLNPHADLQRLVAGTVLLVPDATAGDDSASVAGEAFDSFANQLLAGLETAADQVNSGHAARLTEGKEVSTALRSAALKKAMEADPDLKAQVDQANLVLKQDTADASAASSSLRLMQTQVKEELEALAKLLG